MTLHINFTRSIELVPADECEPVAVIICGGASWDVRKAEQLIKAAPLMYAAIGNLIKAVVAAGDINDGTIAEAVLNAERAELAARGGVLKKE